MLYRRLGKTELKVSLIGFGAMRIPSVTVKESTNTVRYAVEVGINIFETAPGYADSEKRLGIALEGLRDKIFLSSKTSRRDGKGARKDLEESLRRMKTDYLDLYHLWAVNHRYEFEQAILPKGALDEIKKAKEEGLVRFIGITTHASIEDITYFIKTIPFDIVEVYYNVADRSPRVVLPIAKELDIGVMIMGPLRGGLLAHNSDKLSFLRCGLDISNAQGALLWLSSQDELSTLLVGFRHRREIEEAVKVVDLKPLGIEDLSSVAQDMESLTKGKVNLCGGCGYCAPCPEGVFVSAILSLLFYYDVLELKDYASKQYRTFGIKADACNECGECLSRCPHKIDIPAKLKEAHIKMA